MPRGEVEQACRAVDRHSRIECAVDVDVRPELSQKIRRLDLLAVPIAQYAAEPERLGYGPAHLVPPPDDFIRHTPVERQAGQVLRPAVMDLVGRRQRRQELRDAEIE